MTVKRGEKGGRYGEKRGKKALEKKRELRLLVFFQAALAPCFFFQAAPAPAPYTFKSGSGSCVFLTAPAPYLFFSKTN